MRTRSLLISIILGLGFGFAPLACWASEYSSDTGADNSSGQCPQGYTSAMCAKWQKYNNLRENNSDHLEDISEQHGSGKDSSDGPKVYSSASEMMRSNTYNQQQKRVSRPGPHNAYSGSDSGNSNTSTQTAQSSGDTQTQTSQSQSSGNGDDNSNGGQEDWQNLYF